MGQVASLCGGKKNASILGRTQTQRKMSSEPCEEEKTDKAGEVVSIRRQEMMKQEIGEILHS